MKTNFQTQKMKLFLLLNLFMLSQSCSKDPASNNNGKGKNTYYYITLALLNQTPYFTNPAFDTISFTNDKEDTLTFVKTKTDTIWFCEKSSGSPDNNDIDCYQTIHNSYTTTKGVGGFDVKHIKNNKYLNSFIQLIFNDKIFYYDDVAIDDIIFPNYIGEVIKNGKSFKKVIYLYHHDSLNAIGYTNKEFGLFYIEDKTNNLKYLINK